MYFHLLKNFGVRGKQKGNKPRVIQYFLIYHYYFVYPFCFGILNCIPKHLLLKVDTKMSLLSGYNIDITIVKKSRRLNGRRF